MGRMDDFQTISLSNKRMLEPRRRASEDALCTRRRAPFWQRWKAFFWGIIFHGTHLGGSNHANGLTFWWISLTHSALFGLVILLSYKDPCFSICSSHVCWKTFEIWKPSNFSELEIPENGHLHRLKLSCFFFLNNMSFEFATETFLETWEQTTKRISTNRSQGLHQYRATCQAANIQSLEQVIRNGETGGGVLRGSGYLLSG